ncbi:unnamed protein product [Citrullus colocynthis]|uniref:Uncharacterized protein n=1 Tax=Citrullus colocynthis TaxID=252529 RepID=A0ABP0Y4J4_9ROSI
MEKVARGRPFVTTTLHRSPENSIYGVSMGGVKLSEGIGRWEGPIESLARPYFAIGIADANRLSNLVLFRALNPLLKSRRQLRPLPFILFGSSYSPPIAVAIFDFL